MSHQKQSVHAMIVNMFPDGDYSLVLECLTDELGRIYVHVQGVKKMENKHRNMIYQFSLVHLECVQGKRYYRCTGILEWQNHYQVLIQLEAEKKKQLKIVFGMIQRLVPVNIPVPEVFAALIVFYQYFLETELDKEQLQNMSLIAQLRILGILGYWNSDWTDEVFSMESKTFAYVQENRQSVVRLVEKILRETQMNEFVAKSE